MRICANGFISFISSLVITTTIYAGFTDTNDQNTNGQESTTLFAGNVVMAPQGKALPEIVVADGLEKKAISQKLNVGVSQELSSGQVKPTVGNPSLPVSDNVANSNDTAKAVGQKVDSVLDRLMALEAQNSKMQLQLTQLNDRINVLEERLIMGGPHKPKGADTIYGKIEQRLDKLRDHIGRKLFLSLISSVSMVILASLGYLIFYRRKEESFPGSYTQESSSPQEKEDADFNPMEGQEGVAAKLNLARSYIEMGKNAQAQKVLLDALAYGNDNEQEEAKRLLEKVKHPDLDR